MTEVCNPKSQNCGAYMAPNFVFGCTGASGEQELCFTERFTPRAARGAEKEPVLALDAITRGTLSGLTPILTDQETILTNESEYLFAKKYGYLAPYATQRGDAFGQASATPDAQQWRLPSRRDDARRAARIQDWQRARLEDEFVRKNYYAPAGAPGSAAAPSSGGAQPWWSTDSVRRSGGASTALFAGDGSGSMQGMGSAACDAPIMPTGGSCNSMGYIDCQDLTNAPLVAFESRSYHQQGSQKPGYNDCLQTQTTCSSKGCNGTQPVPQPTPPFRMNPNAAGGGSGRHHRHVDPDNYNPDFPDDYAGDDGYDPPFAPTNYCGGGSGGRIPIPPNPYDPYW